MHPSDQLRNRNRSRTGTSRNLSSSSMLRAHSNKHGRNHPKVCVRPRVCVTRNRHQVWTTAATVVLSSTTLMRVRSDLHAAVTATLLRTTTPSAHRCPLNVKHVCTWYNRWPLSPHQPQNQLQMRQRRRNATVARVAKASNSVHAAYSTLILLATVPRGTMPSSTMTLWP